MSQQSARSENEQEDLAEIKEVALPTQFVVWYHSVTNNSWDKDSYVNLCEKLPNQCVETIGDIAKIYSSFQNNVTAGMFFMMRKGILPIWEDPANAQGGFWSFKVSKRSSNDTWLRLTAAFVGGTLLKDAGKMDQITGISVSPKISNCVMKIWNRDRFFNSKDAFTDKIPSLEPSLLLYKANKN